MTRDGARRARRQRRRWPWVVGVAAVALGVVAALLFVRLAPSAPAAADDGRGWIVPPMPAEPAVLWRDIEGAAVTPLLGEGSGLAASLEPERAGRRPGVGVRELRSGRLAWRADYPGVRACQVARGRLVCTDGGTLRSFALSDGRSVRTAALAREALTMTALPSGALAFVSVDDPAQPRGGTMWATEPDGTELWSRPVRFGEGTRSVTSLVTVGELVAVAYVERPGFTVDDRLGSVTRAEDGSAAPDIPDGVSWVRRLPGSDRLAVGTLGVDSGQSWITDLDGQRVADLAGSAMVSPSFAFDGSLPTIPVVRGNPRAPLGVLPSVVLYDYDGKPTATIDDAWPLGVCGGTVITLSGESTDPEIVGWDAAGVRQWGHPFHTGLTWAGLPVGSACDGTRLLTLSTERDAGAGTRMAIVADGPSGRAWTFTPEVWAGYPTVTTFEAGGVRDVGLLIRGGRRVLDTTTWRTIVVGPG